MTEKSLSIDDLVSRRRFLQILGGTGAAVLLSSNSILGSRIRDAEFRLPPTNCLSEYIIGWNAKPWVWINLAIAKNFLHSVKVPPRTEVSLIDLLQFKEMSSCPRDNNDPRKGYIAAQMLNPFELQGWGSGLCLASTAIFRAALNSPMHIIGSSTHYTYYDHDFRTLLLV